MNTTNTFSLDCGQLLRHGGTVFLIVEKTGGHCILQHCITLERKFLDIDTLHHLYLNHELVPCSNVDVSRAKSNDVFEEDDLPIFRSQLAYMSTTTFTHGITVIKYIRALRNMGHTSLRPTPLLQMDYEKLVRQSENTGEPKNNIHLTLSTIYSWSRRIDSNGGDWKCAFPNYANRGGRNQSRLAPETEEAIRTVFENLKKEKLARIRFKDISMAIETTLQNSVRQDQVLFLKPALSTVERITKREFSAYEICLRNKGKAAADKKYRDFYPRDRAQFPMEVVEFDDKDSRVFAVDQANGLPYGRVHVTWGVDQFSTVPVGFSISAHPRSTISALDAYASCLLPKDKCHEELALVDGPVEFFGRPGVALFDNALYNHSRAIETAILETSNAIVSWAKPRTPTEKSAVEDLNGRATTDFFETLPGFGGHKRSLDGLTDGLESACMDVLDFKQRLLVWTYDVFCNTPRAGGMTPRQRWHQGIRGINQRLPDNIHKFNAAFAISHTLKFRPDGILFTGLSYQNPRLITLRRECGFNSFVKFRYHPSSLGQIYVLDPRLNEYFVVNSTCPQYTTGLSLYQHSLIRKMARDVGVKNPSIAQLLVTREKLRVLVSQARHSNKRRERKLANRYAVSDEIPRESIELFDTEVVNDLEFQIDAVSDVLMEPNDESWDVPDDF